MKPAPASVAGAQIDGVRASAYTVPTATPESDGTMAWRETTLVLVQLDGEGATGLGYTYADATAAALIDSVLKPVIVDQAVADGPTVHLALLERVRNLGRPGVASMAIAAVDTAWWDLKAKLLDLSLLDLLGAAREAAPVYGSGGFTSYSVDELQAQLGGWAEAGFRSVKMKVGRDPVADRRRVAAARRAIGPEVELYVDANGAYSCAEAIAQARHFADCGVTWFEEPVTADDLAGLRRVRDHAPPGMRIAAGEYAWLPDDFRALLQAGAVDVLQADATRCAGVSGFLGAAVLARAHHAQFSFHCAPALHAAPACAAATFATGEYFFDHTRIEERFFEGVPRVENGRIRPDRARPGLGLEFKAEAAAGYRVA